MEKRRFYRTEFKTGGEIIYTGRHIPVTVVDLSLKGALVHPENADVLPDGADVLMRIRLSGSNVAIEAQARFVHQESQYLGFRFTSIDVESMTHLRRLMELNSGDPEEIENELSFLKEG